MRLATFPVQKSGRQNLFWTRVKTAKTQIFATPIEGVLLFYVALPKAAVLDQGTHWQLTVKDIDGSETTIDKRVGDWLSR
jgi:hypothetical protein